MLLYSQRARLVLFWRGNALNLRTMILWVVVFKASDLILNVLPVIQNQVAVDFADGLNQEIAILVRLLQVHAPLKSYREYLQPPATATAALGLVPPRPRSAAGPLSRKRPTLRAHPRSSDTSLVFCVCMIVSMT